MLDHREHMYKHQERLNNALQKWEREGYPYTVKQPSYLRQGLAAIGTLFVSVGTRLQLEDKRQPTPAPGVIVMGK